jgi:hypothetical protein
MFICIVLDRASFQLLLADVQEDINGEMNAREAKDARRRFSEEGMYLYVYLMDICMTIFTCTCIHICIYECLRGERCKEKIF